MGLQLVAEGVMGGGVESIKVPGFSIELSAKQLTDAWVAGILSDTAYIWLWLKMRSEKDGGTVQVTDGWIDTLIADTEGTTSTDKPKSLTREKVLKAIASLEGKEAAVTTVKQLTLSLI